MCSVGTTQDSFDIGGETVFVKGGRCQTANGTLAGSDLDMLSAVNNCAVFAGIDWFEAARMASLYPAQALGLESELGRIAPGFRASMLALDKDLGLRYSWIDGDCLQH